MAECLGKNMIDKDEYPQTAELESRCVNILGQPVARAARLGRRPAARPPAPARPACSAGWRCCGAGARGARRAPTARPNLVMGANVQVCWEKFCRYWEVEPGWCRWSRTGCHLSGPEAAARCDENTIGVVAILGSTFDGSYEPVAEIGGELDRARGRGGPDVPIHVDAASGGFVAPVHPARVWSGTSGSPGWPRSTPPGTSTGWCIPASAGWSGVTPERCPRTWCSRSTTWAGKCPRSR